MSDKVPASRVRAPNFTREEQELLTDLLKPYLHIIECKKTGVIKLSQKYEAWSKVCLAYNTNTRNGPRTKKSLINCYRNMKKKRKKQHFETEMDSRGKIDKENNCNNTIQGTETAKSKLVILQAELLSMKMKHNFFLKESELIKTKHKLEIQRLQLNLEHNRKMQELKLKYALEQDKFNEEIRRKKLMLLDLENKTQ